MSALARRNPSLPVPQVLAAPLGVRERLIALYRERDAADEAEYVSGRRSVRGRVYAVGLARLEADADAYETYGMIAAAGVELPDESLDLVGSLPQAWQRICRIDADGHVWTASLAEKGSRRR